MPQLSPGLAQQYDNLFAGCEILPEHLNDVDAIIARIVASRDRYETVSTPLGIPWYVVAVIHYRESDLDFTTHLYNGDPLTAKTVHVPAGLPPGNPPFTWEYSAGQALQYDGLVDWTDWSVAGTLFMLEGYNGFGYMNLNPPVNSPYLWSFSNQYVRGKFVADGTYNPNAVDDQCGAAVLLKRMFDRDITEVDSPLRRISILVNNTPTTITGFLIASQVWTAARTLVAPLAASVVAAGGDPFSITLAAQNQEMIFVAQLISGVGYVLFSEFIPMYGYAYAFDGVRLELDVTIP